jgi:hypothetical protein
MIKYVQSLPVEKGKITDIVLSFYLSVKFGEGMKSHMKGEKQMVGAV